MPSSTPLNPPPPPQKKTYNTPLIFAATPCPGSPGITDDDPSCHGIVEDSSRIRIVADEYSSRFIFALLTSVPPHTPPGYSSHIFIARGDALMRPFLRTLSDNPARVLHTHSPSPLLLSSIPQSFLVLWGNPV